MEWGSWIKKFVYYEGSLKNLILGLVYKKKQYIGGIVQKWSCWTVYRFKRGLGRKGRVVRYRKLNHRLTDFLLGVNL